MQGNGMTTNWYRSETWMKPWCGLICLLREPWSPVVLKQCFSKQLGMRKRGSLLCFPALQMEPSWSQWLFSAERLCPKTNSVLVFWFTFIQGVGWMKTVWNCGSRRCGVQDLVVQAIPRASLSGILLVLTRVILQSSSWKEIVQLKQSFRGAWRAWCSHLMFV